ncbi:MAG: N-6 DNA methylase [Candidatus Jordarchaeaceae archaeon]
MVQLIPKEFPSAEKLRLEFGQKSQIYSETIHKLRSLWEKVKNKESVGLKFGHWKNSFKLYEPEPELFIIHTYLASLVKLIIYSKLESQVEIDKERIREVLDGNYFISYGISNFVEDDFFTWVLHDEIIDASLELFLKMAKKLSTYDLSQIDEDFFKEIYEDIILRDERHKAGEYYTPEWLSQLILLEVLKLWNEKHLKIPKILDPACGSGTFLCNAIHLLLEKTKFHLTSDKLLEVILNNVVGVDINPVATLLAKANYVIALGDLVKRGTPITLPIHTGDALKSLKNMLVEFDILIGNPPWLVMRSVKNREYQDFLKNEILYYKLLRKDDIYLFTQIEMATLFFCKCADLYLKPNGIIGFVMPKSVLAGTIQHINFRRFETPQLNLVKILDLENVSPLFNMPSCVLIAIKSENTKYPVLTDMYVGELLKRNAKLNEVKNLFSVKRYDYSPPEFPTKPSYYFEKFKVGASIFPRTLYFVDISTQIDNTFLAVKTSEEIFRLVKYPYKVELKGKVESKFVYATVLAWEIIPFGYVKMRPVILPIQPNSNSFKLYDIDALEGFLGITEWFKKAQKIWEEKRTEKSKKRFPRLIDRLNYNELLTSQNPSKRYIVLYNATGTNVVSCVVDRLSLPNFEISNGEIKPRNFVVDVKTWFYETSEKMEAYYLCAILNSEIINILIKPLQPRGLFGARAIHRRPLFFQIPKFDKNEKLHIELAKIGELCDRKIKQNKLIKKNNMRSYLRNYLEKEMVRINKLVSILLGLEVPNDDLKCQQI